MNADADGFWKRSTEDGAMSYRYTLTLTHAEYETLSWFDARGYDCGLLAVLRECDTTRDEAFTGDDPGQLVTFEIPEHLAWEVRDQNDPETSDDPDAAFACLDWNSSLGMKVRDFLEAIT